MTRYDYYVPSHQPCQPCPAQGPLALARPGPIGPAAALFALPNPGLAGSGSRSRVPDSRPRACSESSLRAPPWPMPGSPPSSTQGTGLKPSEGTLRVPAAASRGGSAGQPRSGPRASLGSEQCALEALDCLSSIAGDQRAACLRRLALPFSLSLSLSLSHAAVKPSPYPRPATTRLHAPGLSK